MDYLTLSTVKVGNEFDTYGARYCECYVVGLLPGEDDYAFVILYPGIDGYCMGVATRKKAITMAEMAMPMYMELYCTRAFSALNGDVEKYFGKEFSLFSIVIGNKLKEGWTPELKVFEIAKK